MKVLALVLLIAIPSLAQNSTSTQPERLGTVNFATSCSTEVSVSFNRGVALLHDFWYEEAQRQFEQIAKTDSRCAMPHWGVAMSVFHQIWNRPDAKEMKLGWSQLKKAHSLHAHTPREQAYISALSLFYRPAKQKFEDRVAAYSEAMAKVYHDYPDDVDAGAFYALSILAAKRMDDASVDPEQKALSVLTPLFANNPDHPGLAHYIIHSCDNPTLAQQGLEAAQRYGQIAPSGAHAAHMPGHIFARLGMWQADIDANVTSVAAAERVIKDHPASIFDELHASHFLLYAYLQSGQDANGKAVLDRTMNELTAETSSHSMPGMGAMSMSGMKMAYRSAFPAIYYLELRDWNAAEELKPVSGASPDLQTYTYWAHIIADGHLRKSDAAKTDLAAHTQLVEQMKKSHGLFSADSTWARIENDEVLGWAAFAEGKNDDAVHHLRAAADLQDKVGQGEVDIPAREMLADVYLESGQPQKALIEYESALKASPNRFNGLFHAGQAAEAAGDKTKATQYYAALLKITGNGTQSSRPEFAHIKTFMAGSNQVATR